MSSNDDLIKWLAVGFLVGLVTAALALEYYGYIKHSVPEDARIIDEFRLLSIATDEDLKISPKDSGKIAFCADGYLLLRPDNDKPVAGVLVDSKKRGIRCNF